ncbi:LptF/LptG family permease [Verrucomicrobiota bacterium]
MKTIHKHITVGFLVTFFATLVVLTFVMSIGVIFKITDLLARGVAWRSICYVFLCGLPPALAFSIPVSALTSSLLVFGRLSADGEITAMKACGISMRQIISPCLLVALLLMTLCIYINNELAPICHHARRQVIATLGTGSPMEFFEEEGRFIQDFDGLVIYIGKKKQDHFKDIRIYDLREAGVRREIQAEWGTIGMDTNKNELLIDLHNGHIDPLHKDTPGRTVFKGKLSLPPIKNALKRRVPSKRVEGMTMSELIDGIRYTNVRFPEFNHNDITRAKTALTVELNKRFALSISCFAFVLLGVPLGITAHRKESSVGVGISLFLVFNFYLFVIIAESLSKRPEVCPHLILWVPVIISVTIGSWLVHRAN